MEICTCRRVKLSLDIISAWERLKLDSESLQLYVRDLLFPMLRLGLFR